MLPLIRMLLLVVICFPVAFSFGQKKPSQPKTFTANALEEIAFPLGGIGTGCVSLGGRGDLRNWEIFGKPDKGSRLDFSFFAVWAQARGKQGVAKVLERRFAPSYGDRGHGLAQQQLSGLPRMSEAVFRGEFPFAWINFKDRDLPVEISLEAWNPFIPLDVENSALPMAIFTWKIKNPTKDTIDVSLAANLFNPIGSRYTNVKGERPGLGKNLNVYLEKGDVRGLYLTSLKVQEDDPNYGSMALTTSWPDVNVQTRWYRGGWWDQCHVFWDDFSKDGRIRQVRDTSASAENRSDVGSLVLRATLPPRSEVSLPVFLTWYFPNRENYWNGEKEVRGKMMRNYVAGKFTDAISVADYANNNLTKLEKETRTFHDALFGTSLPDYVIDAISSQMSTLKSTVCILLEDGSFFGFEGVSDQGGCCPMNCTHVWNYEQTLAYLFPQLERSMRETDFLHNTLPNGYMTFRTLLPLGDNQWKFKACADGQMGSIIRAYRDWKLSGDTEWLRRLWPKIKSALEFAWLGSGDPPPQGYEWTKEQVSMPWDPDKNGVMEGEQHNTYDIEFYGPNTMMGSLYLGALKAGAEIAEAMKEPDKATEYRGLFESGKKLYDEKLWAGDYYIQDIYVLDGLKVPEHLVSPEDEECEDGCECDTVPGGKTKALDSAHVVPKYQYGKGCLSDQLLGQYLAHVAGLGYVLDKDHVKQAMQSIYRYNFRPSMKDFANVQRVYAVNDEAGLLLCSWPHGDRPALPFVYSDEVWTGIEYQVAATLIYNGWVKEGLEVVKGVRARYSGFNRNPWDEVECGHHYARAMASWAVMLALTGYHYDGVTGHIEFSPVMNAGNFATFWSCGRAWGSYEQVQKKGETVIRLSVSKGSLWVESISLGSISGKPAVGNGRVTLNGAKQAATIEMKDKRLLLRLSEPATIPEGSVLQVIL